MKKIITILFVGLLFVSCTKEVKNNDDSKVSRVKSVTLNQFAVINTLAEGSYLSNITYKEIKQAGNFGLGTFNYLNGEMVALNGKFYQAKVDGNVNLVKDSDCSPFAAVHHFIADQTVNVENEIVNFDELQNYLSNYISNNKNIYSFKIHAEFDSITVRSVPAQSLPFPPLADVIKNQTLFNLKNIKGTLVGYWFPHYLSNVNAPGFHFHFISDDEKNAGHVISCSFSKANVEIDELSKLNLVIPQNEEYQSN